MKPVIIRQIYNHNLSWLPIYFAVTGCFILIFLKPFSIENANHNLLFYGLLSGYGILNMLACYGLLKFMDGISSVLNIKFSSKIIFLGSLLILCCIINYGYANFLHFYLDDYMGFQFLKKPFTEMAWKTIMVALVPLGSFGLYDYMSRYQKDDKSTQSKADVADQVFLKADHTNDWISLQADMIYYIKNEDNYVSIHYRVSGSKFKSKLLRSSMTRIEQRLCSDLFIRCHQSYIVNRHKIMEICSKEGRLLVKLRDIETDIPVARRRKKFMEEQLKRPFA